MSAKLRSWWKQIKQHRVAIGVIAIGLIVIIGLVITGYLFDWTGFNGYKKVTIVRIISGINAGTVTKTEEPQPGKALWDWLQLLIIPLVLAVGGYVFNLTVSRNEQQNTRVRDQTEREISLDNQQEAALQAYIDKMSELLLEKKLRESVAEDEVRKIARVRTLTVLPRLDNKRKGSVLQFLHESGLIEKDKAIVDLDGADLSNANLVNANLHSTDLSGTDLSDADLNDADLMSANLSSAIVTQEQLDKADLLQGATMPNRSIHP